MTRICRDEDCPSCGWPETYAEVDFDKPIPGAEAVGCSKCGWRQEADPRWLDQTQGDTDDVPAQGLPARLPDSGRARQPWEFFDGD